MTSSIDQLPAGLDVSCVAGDPLLWNITVAGATFTSPTLELRTYVGDTLVPGVTGSIGIVGSIINVSLSAADTLAIKALGRPTGPTTVVWTVSALVNGTGPYRIAAGRATIDPPGTAGPSMQTSSTYSLTVAGLTPITLTVALGVNPVVAPGHPLESGGTRLGVPGVSISAAATRAATALRLHYMPIIVTSPVTFDAIVAEITTAAGTVARLGVFTADTAWQPTGLVVDAGTIDTTSIGVKTATCAATTLQPGRYLIAFVADGTVTLRIARGALAIGAISSAMGASLTEVLYYKAAAGFPDLVLIHEGVGVGAFSSPGVPWDTILVGTTQTEYLAFLRIAAA